jgi:2-acylglycerol O-acyltransferase 2
LLLWVIGNPMTILLFSFLLLPYLLYAYCHPYSVALLLPYYVFCFIDKAPRRGGRPFACCRRLSFWKHFCEYFPQRLIKTVDLDPSKTYLFGYHPHGIISMGAMGSFGTDGSGMRG